MNHSKLVILLTHLHPAERKELQKWIRFHAGGHASFQLFQRLLRYIERDKTDLINKEKIYRSLYPGKKYNDLKMRFMSCELLRYCEDYIVYKNTSQNNFQYRLSLLGFYRKRNLPKFFEQTFDCIKKELADLELRDNDYFFVNMEADREYNLFLKSKQNRTIEPKIQQLSDDLDLFYLLNKIMLYCEALNFKNIVKTEYNIRFIDDLLKEIKDDDLEKFPVLHVHYLALMTLREDDDTQHFLRLKKQIDINRKLISNDELRDLYTLARNYCIRKINLGNQLFSRELFDLYQRELELLKQSETGELSPMIYKNITSLAFKIEEHDWAYNFIQQYTNHLPEEHRNSYYSFNMARYFFIKKDCQSVIGLLSHVEYTDFFIQLSAKALLLKTYLEMDEFNAFDSLAHSFRGLITNKKGLGYHRANYMNFIKYSEKLVSRKSMNKKETARLKSEIQQTKEVIDKEWLLEKLE